jgi:hypothetical protein
MKDTYSYLLFTVLQWEVVYISSWGQDTADKKTLPFDRAFVFNMFFAKKKLVMLFA